MLPDKNIWKKEFVNEKFHENLKLLIKDQTKTKTRIELGYHHYINSPRYVLLMCNNHMQLDSFYYIDYIKKNSSSSRIVDIGCGENFFSYFFDDIIGLDPYLSVKNPDFIFNDQFVTNNYQKFDNAIAINSLHFIVMENFKKRILDFASVIKPDGYGYASFNYPRMKIKLDWSNAQIFEYIKEQVKTIDLNFICIEYLQNKDDRDNPIDGNIRLLFKK